MEHEEWRSIAGYEGKYEVSNLGRVKATSFTNNKCKNTPWNHIMRPFDNGHGYLVVSLTKDGARKNHYVHRLVATAFLVNDSGKDEVNHIDHDKQNNRASNLEWADRKENVGYSAGLMRHPKNGTKLSSTGEKYIQIRNGRYRVVVKSAGVDRSFQSLEAAIAFRNGVIK